MFSAGWRRLGNTLKLDSPHLRQSEGPRYAAVRRGFVVGPAVAAERAAPGPVSLQSTERSTARILRSTLAVAHQSCWE